MIAKVDGIHSNEYLVMGTQSNIDSIDQDMHFKCRAWKPRGAKSYSILWSYNTDYYGMKVDSVTGYTTFAVQYYTTVKEGKFQL